jgi:uncharacterized protein (TIGR03435 family)
MMKSSALALFAFAIATVSWAPTQLMKKPAFEVASIKLNTAPEGNASLGDQPGGRFVASRITLRRVIQYAYRDNQQFLGGPDWLDTDRWDIEAKAPEGTVSARINPINVSVPDTIALMLQGLLEERFKLKTHRDTRELPVYELLVAKGGAKVRLSEDQTTPAALVGGGGAQRGGVLPRGGIHLGRTDMEAQAQPISLLAAALGALYAGRPVLDKTGLKGLYDIELRWTPDPGLVAPVNPGAAPATLSGPSFFSALEEQLGLKLESSRGPLPVLVIDSIDRPLEN